MLTKRALENRRFGRVVQSCARAVRIHVVDLLRLQARFSEGELDRLCGRLDARLCDVTGIGGRAVADELGVDAHATCPGALPLFEDKNARAFTDDDPLAIAAERPA